MATATTAVSTLETKAVNTESQVLKSRSCEFTDQWQLMDMQPALSNSVRGSGTRTDRCSSSVRITGTHTAITFQPRAVRVGHEQLGEDFDWALALTEDSGTNE